MPVIQTSRAKAGAETNKIKHIRIIIIFCSSPSFNHATSRLKGKEIDDSASPRSQARLGNAIIRRRAAAPPFSPPFPGEAAIMLNISG
jgi:hypothetical protein